jgi:hypothetical protein
MPLNWSPLRLGAQNLVSYPDATITGAAAAAQILPSNPTRTSVYLYNVGSSNARIGDSSTGATQGAPVASNQGISIETTDAIYCYSASGTTIAILEAVRP